MKMINLKYSDYSVFGTDAQTIVNTVNCMGVMGAGIALEFRLRYPEMLEDYSKRCQNHEVRTGYPYLYKHDDIWILNFPTKYHWKYNSKLEWIENGLKHFKDNYEREGIRSVAFPRLGTDKGGLTWADVNELMKKYLEDIDIPVYICMDKKPDNIEKNMIDFLNKSDVDELVNNIKLKKHIARKIIQNLPLKRFRELLSIDGVAKKSYETLHNYIYEGIICGTIPKGQSKRTLLDHY